LNVVLASHHEPPELRPDVLGRDLLIARAAAAAVQRVAREQFQVRTHGGFTDGGRG